MSVIPTKEQVLEELEQFDRDYGDGDEFRNIVADYVLQVAEEASNSHGRVGPMVAHPHDVLLCIYDAMLQFDQPGDQPTAGEATKAVFKALDERFTIIQEN